MNQSGIGLVESLVAIAILGVAAVSFVSSLSAGAVAVNTLNEQTVSQQLLTSEMETLKGIAYDINGNAYPVINTPEGYNLTVAVNSHIYADTDLQKITLVVRHNGVQVAQLENYKVNR